MGLEQRFRCREKRRAGVIALIRINEIDVPLGADPETIKKAAAKILRISPSDFTSFEILRESADCRKQDRVRMIYSALVGTTADESALVSRFPPNKVALAETYRYRLPENRRRSRFRPVVVGFGPAGMFAALILARAGLKPLILERGRAVEQRVTDVQTFWKTRRLQTESNVQFGEGGAGTFSDGKLTTGIKDPRCRFVLQSFCAFGAPEQILYSSHPHIGTDKLVGVVRNIRNEILGLGGEIRFGACLTDIIASNGYVQGISCRDATGASVDIETDTVLLCIGHSARDTVEMLRRNGFRMEQKAFSVGVRIEHPQELINKSLYGKFWNDPRLGAASYKLANHPPHGRGGYTFCMCPGGTVVCASSEEDMVVVNGMSAFARDGENANSAILVGIEPAFFESDDPLAGFAFQRQLERRAFQAGGCSYAAPAQTVGDFLRGVPSRSFGSVSPTCTTGAVPSDIRTILPSVVTDGIASAISAFDKKLSGFALPEAVLTAPESRSSSPVRIIRDECRQSSVKGVFPCGEGAGYAGGIVSAAVDGIKSAEAVLADEIDDC